MLTPAEEVRSQMSDHLDDDLQRDGLTLSEVTSEVVTPADGKDAQSAVRVKRLDEDEHTGCVSFVVTTCTPVKNGEGGVLERSVRIHTPLPSRPKRRVNPVQRYSPSGSAMSPQTLTSISEARLTARPCATAHGRTVQPSADAELSVALDNRYVTGCSRQCCSYRGRA